MEAKTLPIGGTTGLSHGHSAAVDQAAEWLAALQDHDRPRPIVPLLRQLFGLTALEAVEAIREAAARGRALA
jgi:hypothetical protein